MIFWFRLCDVLIKRKSLTGYILTLLGCTINSKKTLQPIVILFTIEVKYIIVIEVVKEAIWLRGLVEDFGLHQGVTAVFCDNQSAIHLTKHQMYHERTKHIDVRYHFIREINVIKVKKISIADNPADMMTKPIPSHKFEHYLELLGVYSGEV